MQARSNDDDDDEAKVIVMNKMNVAATDGNKLEASIFSM